MEVSVRGATEDDLDDLARLAAEVHDLHATAEPHVIRPADVGQSRATLAEVLAKPDAAIFAAEGDGRLLGYVWVEEWAAPDHPVLVPRRHAFVHELVVAEDVRRRGLGHLLMDRGHRWAAERGLAEVELNVHEFNRAAVALYEGLGYATAQRTLRLTLPDRDRQADQETSAGNKASL